MRLSVFRNCGSGIRIKTAELSSHLQCLKAWYRTSFQSIPSKCCVARTAKYRVEEITLFDLILNYGTETSWFLPPNTGVNPVNTEQILDILGNQKRKTWFAFQKLSSRTKNWARVDVASVSIWNLGSSMASSGSLGFHQHKEKLESLEYRKKMVGLIGLASCWKNKVQTHWILVVPCFFYQEKTSPERGIPKICKFIYWWWLRSIWRFGFFQTNQDVPVPVLCFSCSRAAECTTCTSQISLSFALFYPLASYLLATWGVTS